MVEATVYIKAWSIANTTEETKMTEEIKDVNAKIDEAEAAMKKYASKDTVISIGGYEFTPAKLMIAATIVSSTLGGLYGVFEVYKDYMGMKDKIAKYVSPDLTEIYKKLEVLEANTNKTLVTQAATAVAALTQSAWV